MTPQTSSSPLKTLLDNNGIRIVPFEPTHQVSVIELFQNGLNSHVEGDNVPQERKRLFQNFLESKMKNDMKDIHKFYIQRTKLPDIENVQGLSFLVALNRENSVVGCVGIQASTFDENDKDMHSADITKADTVELVRMSVRPDCRGLGIGTKLVRAVEEFAKSNGYRRVGFATLDIMKPAVSLYKSCGYLIAKQRPIQFEKMYGPGEYAPVDIIYFRRDV